MPFQIFFRIEEHQLLNRRREVSHHRVEKKQEDWLWDTSTLLRSTGLHSHLRSPGAGALGPYGLMARFYPPVLSLRSSWCLLRPPCALRPVASLVLLVSGVSWIPPLFPPGPSGVSLDPPACPPVSLVSLGSYSRTVIGRGYSSGKAVSAPIMHLLSSGQRDAHAAMSATAIRIGPPGYFIHTSITTPIVSALKTIIPGAL